MSDLAIIKARQRAWALRNTRTFDADGYCACVDDNIFRTLSLGAREDFENGDGTELGKGGKRGKIQALHSSSALACNWFDYWRDKNLEPLAQAFGKPARYSTLKLEQKLSTGLGGIGPNLDVLLRGDEVTFAIESKFTESYTKSTNKTFLKSKYLPEERRLWTEVGLPGCQTLAERLNERQHNFKVLDVAQLLKHMLALAHNCDHDWSLCCLWFEIPGALARQHRQELNDFATVLGDDGTHFMALTYQELFDRMLPLVGQNHFEYIAYLRDRYMSAE